LSSQRGWGSGEPSFWESQRTTTGWVEGRRGATLSKEELLEQLRSETEALRAPISDGQPAGDDLSFDAAFEDIKNEIDKLTNLVGGEPDWSMISRNCAELLTNRTLDMRLATWYAFANLKTGGWLGLCKGMVVLHDISSNYWAEMYPPARRAKGRANMAEWLYQMCEPVLQEMRITMRDADAVNLADQLFNDLDSILDAQISSNNPGLGTFRGVMSGCVRNVPAPPPPPPPPSEVEEDTSSSDSDEDTSYPYEEDDDDSSSGYGDEDGESLSLTADLSNIGESLDGVKQVLTTLAAAMRAKDPARPWSYRLHRIGLWVHLKDAPNAEDNLTEVDGPDDSIRERLLGHVTEENWLDLLNDCEEESKEHPLWLDLQRLAATALERLGGLFVDAREVVGRDSSDFARRFPRLMTLKFNTETPFADEATRQWLQSEAVKWGALSGGGGEDDEAEFMRNFQDARDLVAAGKLEMGLARAIRVARKASDPRSQFKAELAVAKLALENSYPTMAMPILEGLLEKVDQHALEVWEPMLCASLYEAIAACRKQGGAGEEEGAEIKEAANFRRLARLNPAGAFRIMNMG
jgi:type VI secretion system protein VasJ